MTQKILICIGIGLSILIVLALVSRNANGHAAAIQKWEYGQLKFMTTSIPGKEYTVLWLADGQRIEVSGGPFVESHKKVHAEFYQKLGGQDQKEGWEIEIWNLLGTQGWEFVTEAYDIRDPIKYSHVVFKRAR